MGFLPQIALAIGVNLLPIGGGVGVLIFFRFFFFGWGD